MRMLVLTACLIAGPAMADVDKAVTDDLLPAFARFGEETEALVNSALVDCRPAALRPAFQETFDAWIGIGPFQFGPLAEKGRNLAIALWPDNGDMVGKTVVGLVAAKDPAVDSESGFAKVTVAGRGLFALERLLYDETLSDYGRNDYACHLTLAIAADLNRTARDMNAEWPGYAKSLTTAGAAGNKVYPDKRAAKEKLFTALFAGLDFTKTQRLGRPMGTFDEPRPDLAEARRSGRSMRNIILSLKALRRLATDLATGPVPRSEAAFDVAIGYAEGLDDPDLSGAADPTGRLKLEILQQKIARVQNAVAAEIGADLGRVSQ